jgi:hypothetical protein
MSWFKRRPKLDDWAEGIHPELRDVPVPPPSDDLWNRIAASRSAGTRVILPDGTEVKSASAFRYVIPAAVAAALLLVALPFLDRGTPESARDSAGVAAALPVVSEWFTGTVAIAEPVPTVHRAVLPPMRFTRADAIRPLSLEYTITRRDGSGAVTDRMFGLISVRDDESSAVPAWRVVTRDSSPRTTKPVISIDTIVIAKGDLRMLSRTAVVAPYSRYDEIRIRQTFRGDSVVGRMNAKGADAGPMGRPIARRLPPEWGPFMEDALAPFLLGAVDLNADWKASTSIVGWAVVDGDVYFPLELRVVGSERVTVPAGTFDCWRLAIRHRNRDISLWLRKSDGVGVRTRQSPPNGGTQETVLVRVGP